MIELLKGFPDNVVAMSAHDEVRLLYEIGSDFTSYDAGAAWEDFKVGMEHISRWERVAVITDIEWIKHSMQLFGFFMPSVMRVYPLAASAKARLWITQAA